MKISGWNLKFCEFLLLFNVLMFRYKFKNVVEDPSKMNFLFSKLYGTKNAFATVQNNTNVASQSRIPLPHRSRMLKACCSFFKFLNDFYAFLKKV